MAHNVTRFVILLVTMSTQSTPGLGSTLATESEYRVYLIISLGLHRRQGHVLARSVCLRFGSTASAKDPNDFFRPGCVLSLCFSFVLRYLGELLHDFHSMPFL